MKNKIVIACDLKELQKMRQFALEILNSYKVDDKYIYLIISALDEITANRIIHSNNQDKTKNISLEIIIATKQIVFEFRDEGTLDGLKNYELPNLKKLAKEKRKGGLGLLIIDRIMDKTEHFEDNGTSVSRYYKRL